MIGAQHSVMEMMMKKKRFLAFGLALACSLSTFIWYATVSGTEGDPTRDIAPMMRPVPTVIATEMVAEKIRMFPRTAKARNRMDIAFSVEGLLVELNAHEGRSVKKGEILARIDPRDFRNAYDAAKANYQRAEADFERARVLKDRRVLSQAEYDNAKAAYDVALAELNIRKKALDDTVIVAPYHGVVAKRYVENNEHVKKQAPILALKDISEVEVVIQVPERLMAHGGISQFKDIRVKFDADGKRWFPGRVKEFSVQSDTVTRAYDVAVRLPSPSDMEILPGMTATVRIAFSASPTHRNAGKGFSLVPVEAVFSGSGGNAYCWVIPDEGGTPQKVKVTLGALHDRYIQIDHGLQPGDRVATAGVHSLTEEMLVRPMKEGQEGLDG